MQDLKRKRILVNNKNDTIFLLIYSLNKGLTMPFGISIKNTRVKASVVHWTFEKIQKVFDLQHKKVQPLDSPSILIAVNTP